MTCAILPNGPPKTPLTVRFTPRELEFIELRYGQLKALKEICTIWGVSISTAKNHSSMIYRKLDISCNVIDSPTAVIAATKKLIALGYIKPGEKKNEKTCVRVRIGFSSVQPCVRPGRGSRAARRDGWRRQFNSGTQRRSAAIFQQRFESVHGSAERAGSFPGQWRAGSHVQFQFVRIVPFAAGHRRHEPSTAAFPFVGPNPEVAVATLRGASNKVPFFVTADGPIREARFKMVLGPGDRQADADDAPDGSVHDLFTIAGRDDAPGCVLAQPDFDRAARQNNLIFRIPTPVFGLGLLENLSEATLIQNLAATEEKRERLGIGGAFNRSGNDATITRFGWKAQNKSGLMFAGEAYNVEIGVTNELMPNERGNAPASCLFNPTPEDTTIPIPTDGVTDTTSELSDIQDFQIFMRFLDQPTPGPSSPSTIRGSRKFQDIGCALCHSPAMTTAASFVSGLNQVQANLFSDLALHHMGENLADGISQGAAGPDQFRTAPLWGIGQRVFFLHDGRTSDLLDAIQEHKSRGSEANRVIENFNRLSVNDQQDILNFLRSL